jgi:hypothetical protein
MLPVAAIAAKMLAPTVGSVVGSIVGEISQKLTGGLTGAAGGQSPFEVLGNIGKAFEKLFGKKRRQRPHRCQPLPQPFSPGPGFPLANPLGTLKDSLGLLQSLMPNLQKVLSMFPGNQGTGTPNFPGSTPGQSFPTTPSVPGHSGSEGGYGRIDSLMNQAEAILNNPNASEADKLRAQRMMSDAQNLFQMFSKLIQQQSEMMRTAIQNIR